MFLASLPLLLAPSLSLHLIKCGHELWGFGTSFMPIRQGNGIEAMMRANNTDFCEQSNCSLAYVCMFFVSLFGVSCCTIESADAKFILCSASSSCLVHFGQIDYLQYCFPRHVASWSFQQPKECQQPPHWECRKPRGRVLCQTPKMIAYLHLLKIADSVPPFRPPCVPPLCAHPRKILLSREMFRERFLTGFLRIVKYHHR